ncbi:hypothetical protein BLNAU_2176 [Blattamonas nauphoetae]|uniref:Uncharacterized protein n=1 Tax=Blattamonas nauphoetae TaxID=2049346 RepID=A0ABQ9YG54_9EUKA|nr:hypothetical protein BLNAU_2176 [Blattamonas nauphoetae]
MEDAFQLNKHVASNSPHVANRRTPNTEELRWSGMTSEAQEEIKLYQRLEGEKNTSPSPHRRRDRWNDHEVMLGIRKQREADLTRQKKEEERRLREIESKRQEIERLLREEEERKLEKEVKRAELLTPEVGVFEKYVNQSGQRRPKRRDDRDIPGPDQKSQNQPRPYATEELTRHSSKSATYDALSGQRNLGSSVQSPSVVTPQIELDIRDQRTSGKPEGSSQRNREEQHFLSRHNHDHNHEIDYSAKGSVERDSEDSANKGGKSSPNEKETTENRMKRAHDLLSSIHEERKGRKDYSPISPSQSRFSVDDKTQTTEPVQEMNQDLIEVDPHNDSIEMVEIQTDPEEQSWPKHEQDWRVRNRTHEELEDYPPQRPSLSQSERMGTESMNRHRTEQILRERRMRQQPDEPSAGDGKTRTTETRIEEKTDEVTDQTMDVLEKWRKKQREEKERKMKEEESIQITHQREQERREIEEEKWRQERKLQEAIIQQEKARRMEELRKQEESHKREPNRYSTLPVAEEPAHPVKENAVDFKTEEIREDRHAETRKSETAEDILANIRERVRKRMEDEKNQKRAEEEAKRAAEEKERRERDIHQREAERRKEEAELLALDEQIKEETRKQQAESNLPPTQTYPIHNSKSQRTSHSPVIPSSSNHPRTDSSTPAISSSPPPLSRQSQSKQPPTEDSSIGENLPDAQETLSPDSDEMIFSPTPSSISPSHDVSMMRSDPAPNLMLVPYTPVSVSNLTSPPRPPTTNQPSLSNLTESPSRPQCRMSTSGWIGMAGEGEEAIVNQLIGETIARFFFDATARAAEQEGTDPILNDRTQTRDWREEMRKRRERAPIGGTGSPPRESTIDSPKENIVSGSSSAQNSAEDRITARFTRTNLPTKVHSPVFPSAISSPSKYSPPQQTTQIRHNTSPSTQSIPFYASPPPTESAANPSSFSSHRETQQEDLLMERINRRIGALQKRLQNG